MMCEAQKLCSDRIRLADPDARGLSWMPRRRTCNGFPKVPMAAFGGMEWPEYVWLDS